MQSTTETQQRRAAFHISVAQGQRGLVFRMSVARDDEGQRLEDGSDHCWIVLTEGLSGDEGAHVEKAVRLAGLVAIDNREVRSGARAGLLTFCHLSFSQGAISFCASRADQLT